MGRLYIGKLVLGAVLAGAVMTVAAATPAAPAPDDRATCESRLEHARARLNADVARYGEKSRQVDADLERMEQARGWCREHKADYDHDKYDNDGDRRDEHHDDDHR